MNHTKIHIIRVQKGEKREKGIENILMKLWLEFSEA